MKLFKYILILFFTSSILSGSLLAQSVLIDPGHGGDDDGATSYANLFKEKWINQVVADKVKDYLDLYYPSWEVDLTKNSSSQGLTAAQRIQDVDEYDFFVSIHHNSGGTSSHTETYTIYCDQDTGAQSASHVTYSEELGDYLADELEYGLYWYVKHGGRYYDYQSDAWVFPLINYNVNNNVLKNA